jgi:hypothetical protein
MNTIAIIESINNGVFLIKYNGEITEAYIGQELPSGCEIIPDVTNTELSNLVVFVPSLDTTVTLTGQESILLDSEYFELMALLNDPNNPIVTQDGEIVDEEAASNEAFLKEIENMEASAAGAPGEDTTGPEDPSLKALNYNSEYQISSEYETINLDDLTTQNDFQSSRVYGTKDQFLPSKLVMDLDTFNLNEEAIDTNSVIASIDVKDLNNRDYPIEYSITNTQNPEYYNINQNTGEVTLTQAGIDAVNDDSNTDLDSLDFTIVAQDPYSSVSQDVSIPINRVDDNKPTFDTTNTTLVEESLSPDESVAKVIMSDLDDGDLNEDYTMSIDPNNNYFRIDENGNIFLTPEGIAAINSDEGEDLTSTSVDVIITNGEDTIIKTIDFPITRVNDNPVVVDALISNDITEEQISPDTIVANIDVSDLDDTTFNYAVSGEHSEYVEVDENGEVTLTEAGVDAVNNDTLDLTALNFTLQVSDNNSDDIIQRDITIDVTRVNDNAPVISLNNQANPLTEESVDTTTVVAQLSATDADANTTLTYSIKPSATSDYFTVNNDGQVTLTQAGVDAINSDDGVDITSLNVDIIVDDGTYTDEQNVVFDITRINDNAPVITIDSQNDLTEESVTAGDTIAQISATDLDDTDSIIYSKAPDSPNADYFTIDQDGKVTLTQAGVDAINADDSQITTFDIKILASDTLNETPQTLTIDVTRVNDNAPVISLNNQANPLTEESVDTTTVVAQLSATDADANTTLTYSIKPSATSDYFTVNNDGQVTLTQAGVDAINSDDGVDITSLNVDIIVDDGTYTDEQNVVFDITRINDNAPVITIDSQNDLTEESVTAGDTIAQISATDLDDTDSIIYSKAPDSPNADYFTIDQDGKVTLTQAGVDAINADDGADISTFDIKINAFDGSFNTPHTITITVNRVFDTPPQVQLSNFAQLSYETVEMGDTVANIFFSDFDDNDDVTYEIIQGNDDSYFAIDNNADSIIVTNDGATYIQNERAEETITNLVIKGTDLGGNEVFKTVLVKSIASHNVMETDFPADGYLDGTPSEDNIEYDNTPIDGKAGFDTFFLQNNENIDLTGIAKNIEKIDLSVNGAHTIQNLTIDDVINSTDTSNELIIYGNFDDTVELKNETNKEWQNDGEVVENGITYTQYSDARDSGDPTVVLKISEDVDTQVI